MSEMMGRVLISRPFAELSPTLHDALYIAYNINQQRYIWDE